MFDNRRSHFGAGYRITDAWLVPDVSVFRPEQRIENDHLPRAPMIAVALISASNPALELDK